MCNLFWRDREATQPRNRGGVLGGWSQRPARCRGSVLRRVQYQRGVAQALRSSLPTTKLRGCMKIPNEITKAWLSKKGYEVGTVYREKGGHRAVILTPRGRKWVHFLELGAIGSSPSKFKLAVQEAEKLFRPFVRKNGKWKYA